MRCPYCKVKNKFTTLEEKKFIRIVECDLCLTVTTLLDGKIRSYTTYDGDQTIINCPFKSNSNSV